MFKKAERKQVKLKLAITGPSGSGKTYSALRLAKGIGGKVAVIDTENGSAQLYSDRFEFDVLEIEPPYTNEKYLDALAAAIAAKYDTVIIDSLSHQWAGEGGLLNKKEQMDARGGNSYTNWAKMTPEHEKFKSALLHADIHLIGTMRSKQDYVLEQNSKGKQEPKKVGLAPVQRDGMEYEFTTVFDVAMNHEAVSSKDRTSLFIDKFFQITEETGRVLKQWLDAGVVRTEPAPVVGGAGHQPKPVVASPSAAAPAVIPKKQNVPPELQLRFDAFRLKHGWAGTIFEIYLFRRWGTRDVNSLDETQFHELCDVIEVNTTEEQQGKLMTIQYPMSKVVTKTGGAA